MLESLGSLSGPVAYLMVGLFATLETAALVGLFVPGELAMIAGGYIAYRGKADLIPMIILATVCATTGDSLGYLLGRRFGPSLKRTKLGVKVGEERWYKAEQYLVKRGGRAVFLGRFVGVLRALVPTLAGASHMPYRRFVIWSALGAAIWAPTIVGIGYLAGSQYKRVEGYAGQAGLVLLGIIATVGLVAAIGRWVASHPDEVRAFWQRQVSRPLPAKIHTRYRAQIQFLAGRFRPGRALGLALTVQLVFLGVAAWGFGSIARDVLTGRGAARVDEPVTRALVDHRVDWLTSALDQLSAIGGGFALVVFVAVAGLLARRFTGSWLPLLTLGVCLAGAGVLDDVVKPVIGRDRPEMGPAVAAGSGSAFPSGHATQSVAVYGAVAYLVAGRVRTWSARVAAWTIALVLVLLVGFSRIYLGVHWLTDVLGGYALGALWLAAVLVTISAVRGAIDRRHPAAVGQIRANPDEQEAVSPGGAPDRAG